MNFNNGYEYFNVFWRGKPMSVPFTLVWCDSWMFQGSRCKCVTGLLKLMLWVKSSQTGHWILIIVLKERSENVKNRTVAFHKDGLEPIRRFLTSWTWALLTGTRVKFPKWPQIHLQDDNSLLRKLKMKAMDWPNMSPDLSLNERLRGIHRRVFY